MHRRLLLSTLVAAPLLASCGSFQDKRTPSGDFCSDMPVLPAGQVPDREYHRLQPIQSDPESHTEAERLESLRKAACKAGADAVIEAANEEVRQSNAGYSLISSGTAVTWVRRTTNDVKPITSYPTHTNASSPATPTAEPEASTSAEEPSPAASVAAAAKSGSPAAGAAPAKSGSPAAGAAPAKSGSPAVTPIGGPKPPAKTPLKSPGSGAGAAGAAKPPSSAAKP